MDNYFVTLRDRLTGNRRQLRFAAEDFSHAEEQTEPYLEGDELIGISKDYAGDNDPED